MIKRGILFYLLCMSLFPLAFAEELYVDTTLTVSETGGLTITSLTNSPFFEDQLTNEFTSKDGKVWSLNITDVNQYVDMYYEISLPQNAEINYLQSSISSRFYVEDGIPKVKGFGNNDTFEVFVQYELGKNIDKSSLAGKYLFWFIGLLFVFILYVFLSTFRKSKHTVVTNATKQSQSNSQLSEKTLHLEQRQKDIVQLLQRRGKLTQKQLADYLSLPKSSVFRNIRSLEQKGIIQKERMGMSTIISLTDSTSEKK